MEVARIEGLGAAKWQALCLFSQAWKSFRTLQIQEPGAPKELQDRLRRGGDFWSSSLEIGFFWCLDFVWRF